MILFFGTVTYKKKIGTLTYLVIVNSQHTCTSGKLDLKKKKFYIEKVWQNLKSTHISKSAVAATVVAARVGHHVSDQQPAEQPSRQPGP